MAVTYESIATTTFGSAATSYTFSSIPQTYTDLLLVISSRAGVNPGYGIGLEINSDTGTNYNFTYVYGTGSTVATSDKSNQTMLVPTYGTGLGTGSPSIFRVHFMNYRNTSVFKSVISRGENFDTSYGGTEFLVGMWRSTSAMTSLKVYAPYGSMTLNTNTMMTLYGILAA